MSEDEEVLAFDEDGDLEEKKVKRKKRVKLRQQNQESAKKRKLGKFAWSFRDGFYSYCFI